jgi:thymidylate kinase
MGRMILVEGLDLAGKSSLIEGLAHHYRRLGWTVTVSHGDLCADNPVGRVTREMMRWDPGFTPEEGGPLFLASHLWDQRNFYAPEGDMELHIQDSCALRTLAFERVVGKPDFAAKLEEVVDRLPLFDAAYVLTATLTTRRERYARRADNDLHDAFMLRDPVRFSRVDSELMHLAVQKCRARLLPTDDWSREQLLAMVLSDLARRELKGAGMPSRNQVAPQQSREPKTDVMPVAGPRTASLRPRATEDAGSDSRETLVETSGRRIA